MAKKKKPAGGIAVIYARYSSHNQRDVSIEQQIEACRKHAAELGLTIIATYEDRAISGRTDNRPAFQRLMHDAEKGKFSYVLAWKSNRMGRNMMQAMVNESRLMDCGIKVYYAEEDFDDSAAGRFALRSMMNVNQFYSDNLAEDVRRGLMDNANKCMVNGRQPLGYKRGKDGKVVVDEPAAAIVREVYTRVASGELFTDIARDLNRRGIKTADKGEWNKNSFHRLCSNEKYRGIYIYGDVRIEGGIPTIIDDPLWYKVQEALRVKKLKRNGRHRPGDEDYLLTGKLRCGKCGGYMIGMSGRSKTGDIHYYYACQNRRVGRTCDKKNIRRDVIEPAVAQAIKEYCLTDDAIEWIADKTVEYWEKADRNLQLDSIEGDLAAVQSSISNVMKAIEMGVVTETTRDRLIELEKQRTDLKSKLALAKEEVVHVDRKKLISSLLLFRNGDIHDRQYQEDLFKTFLISVYVYDDDDNGHLKIVFNAFGDNNTVDLPIDFGETDNQSAFSDGVEKFDYSLHRSTKREPDEPSVLHQREEPHRFAVRLFPFHLIASLSHEIKQHVDVLTDGAEIVSSAAPAVIVPDAAAHLRQELFLPHQNGVSDPFVFLYKGFQLLIFFYDTDVGQVLREGTGIEPVRLRVKVQRRQRVQRLIGVPHIGMPVIFFRRLLEASYPILGLADRLIVVEQRLSVIAIELVGVRIAVCIVLVLERLDALRPRGKVKPDAHRLRMGGQSCHDRQGQNARCDRRNKFSSHDKTSFL